MRYTLPMPLFTPPSRFTVPRVRADTPDNDLTPNIYFKSDIPIGVNVWLDTANVISETQPPLAERRLNADGTYTPGVQKVWHGGRTHTITDAEAVLLAAAGYGANITYPAIMDSSTYDSGDYLS